MKKYTYYLVKHDNFIRGVKAFDVIKGQWVYSAPFHPKDNSKVYVLGGLAIGWTQTKMALANREIEKITRKEAINRLLSKVK